MLTCLPSAAISPYVIDSVQTLVPLVMSPLGLTVNGHGLLDHILDSISNGVDLDLFVHDGHGFDVGFVGVHFN